MYRGGQESGGGGQRRHGGLIQDEQTGSISDARTGTASEAGRADDVRLVEAAIGRFDGRLRRYLSRSMKPEDVEDALQEVYTRLARLARTIPPPDFNATYVFKTADSVMRDLYRRQKVRGAGAHAEITHDLAAEQPSPFDTLRWRQNMDRVRNAIARLPAGERRVLLQNRIEGLTLSEIARINRTPMRTVQRQLSQALVKCREMLKDCGWFEI